MVPSVYFHAGPGTLNMRTWLMVSPKAYELPGPDKIAQTNHADLVVIPETVQNPAEDMKPH